MKCHLVVTKVTYCGDLLDADDKPNREAMDAEKTGSFCFPSSLDKLLERTAIAGLNFVS
jgi:hypothetical protein